ncbi:MAG: hypothetical protein K8S98_06285 [Planctomycetes bacterium]|nr:hypothetical protein [Planctomycetota bacterium]
MANHNSGSSDHTAAKARSSSESEDGLRRLADQSSRVIEEVQELGRTAMSSASDATAQLKEKGSAAWAAGRERVGKAKQNFDTVVGEHPMKSVLIALGVGAVLGYALRRRSS